MCRESSHRAASDSKQVQESFQVRPVHILVCAIPRGRATPNMVSAVRIKVGFFKRCIKSTPCLESLRVLCALCVKSFAALQQGVHHREHKGHREELGRE